MVFVDFFAICYGVNMSGWIAGDWYYEAMLAVDLCESGSWCICVGLGYLGIVHDALLRCSILRNPLMFIKELTATYYTKM